MLNTEKVVIHILLMFLLLSCAYVLAPFATALFWAGILSFASWPLMENLTKLLKGNSSLAASILTVVWVVVVAIPLIALGINSTSYIVELDNLIKSIQSTSMPQAPEWLKEVPIVGDYLVQWWGSMDETGTNIISYAKPYIGSVGNWLLAQSAKIGYGLVELALSLILLFFFYRGGPQFFSFIYGLFQRLIGDKAEHYKNLIAGTVTRVVNGVIGTAVLQGVLAYFSFQVASIPGMIFLSVGMFFASIIMFPPIIWAPVSVYLFIQGKTAMGVFMAFWGIVVIGTVENILKPYLISRGGDLPLIVVLFGVIGGMIAFGFMGLFLGPTVLAIAYSFLNDWMQSGIFTSSIHQETDEIL